MVRRVGFFVRQKYLLAVVAVVVLVVGALFVQDIDFSKPALASVTAFAQIQRRGWYFQAPRQLGWNLLFESAGLWPAPIEQEPISTNLPSIPSTPSAPSLQTPTARPVHSTIAYAILLHRIDAMDMACTLIRTLYEPHHWFVIHIDTDVSLDMTLAFVHVLRFELPQVAIHRNIVLLRRVSAEWGKWSVVEMELLCLKWSMQYQWDYWINLSADTFPLMPSLDIEIVLEKLSPTSFIHFLGEYPKVPQYNYRVHMAGGRCHRLFKGQCVKVTGTPGGANVGFGSQWAIIHRGFAEYTLQSNVSRLDEWQRFFSNYIVPDESFFQTMAIQDTLPDGMKVERENMFFIKWNSDGCVRPSDGNHPCTLQPSELSSVDVSVNATRHYLFARKFGVIPCFMNHVRPYCDLHLQQLITDTSI